MDDISAWIAALSFLAALLAALYARWVWGEARRTNQLALHANRLEVYRAFHRLRQAIQENALGVPAQRVGEFLQLTRESKFYFSDPKTSELIEEYFKMCFDLTQQFRKINRDNLTESERKVIEEVQDRLLTREETIFAEADVQIEKELLRGVRRRWFDA